MENQSDDVAELRAAIAEGLAQSLRGESAPIDFTELKRKLREGLDRPNN